MNICQICGQDHFSVDPQPPAQTPPGRVIKIPEVPEDPNWKDNIPLARNNY